MDLDLNQSHLNKSDYLLHMRGRYAVVGPSESGKTHLVENIAFDPSVWEHHPLSIIWCSPGLKNSDPIVQRLKIKASKQNIKLITLDEVPNSEDVRHMIGKSYSQSPINALIVLDDYILFDTNNKKRADKMLTKDAHHDQFAVILIQQNRFEKDQVLGNRNLTGTFLMYQVNDMAQLQKMNAQLFPEKQNFVIRCLTDAYERYGLNYIFINTHPMSKLKRRYRVYTRLFQTDANSQKGPIFFDYTLYNAKRDT